MHEDKRRYMRYNVFLQHFKCLNCDSEDSVIDISDISCTGLGISTTDQLYSGDKMDLEIIFPQDDVPMFITGEIAWAYLENNSEGRYTAGVKFSKISHCDKKRLVRYIQTSHA
ncbi:MAG: PilZ domain-containing protein [Candidatus Tantalella remota]|nr:PilZ domain-containing protein [Candidatus Tantalella remota]